MILAILQRFCRSSKSLGIPWKKALEKLRNPLKKAGIPWKRALKKLRNPLKKKPSKRTVKRPFEDALRKGPQKRTVKKVLKKDHKKRPLKRPLKTVLKTTLKKGPSKNRCAATYAGGTLKNTFKKFAVLLRMLWGPLKIPSKKSLCCYVCCGDP